MNSFIVQSMQSVAMQLPNLPAPQNPGGLYGQRVVFSTNKKVKIDSDTMDMEFDIPFDNDAIPNVASITIYNLSKGTAAKIKRNQTVTIKAGFNKDLGVIFKGKITRVSTRRESVDRVTQISAVDKAAADKSVKKTYAEGVLASFILRDLIKMAGITVGTIKLKKDRPFKDAVTVDGNVNSEIGKYAEMCAVSAYVNKGRLYVRDLKQKPSSKVFVDVSSGMLSSPSEWEESRTDQSIDTSSGENEQKKDNQYVVKGVNITMLLNHRVSTATRITLKSVNKKGVFTVESGNHKYASNSLTTEVRARA